MNSPLVSIVTPFYNTEAYLAECIESVLQQTYSNWEYILVNNCSSDGSAQIAEKYARAYPDRIRVVHNPAFLSQIANYNHALTTISSQSKYCKMVQADDLLFPQCVEMMVQVAEQDPSVGVVGSYALEGRIVCFDGLPFPSPVVSGRTACRHFFLEDFYLFGSPTQLMIRSDLIRCKADFYAESYAPFEDAAAIFDLLRNSSFGFVHQVLTFSRRDNATLMGPLLALDCPTAFNLFMLRDFGREYLTDTEYQAQLDRKERAYAQVLMDGAVSLKGNEFWAFHRDMLQRMDYTSASSRAWRGFLWSLSNVVFNPKRTVSLFVHGLKNRNAHITEERSSVSSVKKSELDLPLTK